LKKSAVHPGPTETRNARPLGRVESDRRSPLRERRRAKRVHERGRDKSGTNI